MTTENEAAEFVKRWEKMAKTAAEEKWRDDAELIIKSLHERICVLEAAVISQQKIMEALATDQLSTPKSRIIRAS